MRLLSIISFGTVCIAASNSNVIKGSARQAEARMRKTIAGEGGNGKSPNQGDGRGVVKTDTPSGGNIAGFCKIPEKSP